MFANHPAAKALTAMGVFKTKPTVILDSATTVAPILDDVGDASSTSAAFALADVRVNAVASVQQWVETTPEDLDEGESMPDRLLAMMIGIADGNMDGEISEDEAAVVDIAFDAAYDYMVAKGVSDDDAIAVLNDGDEAASLRVAELLKSALPEGEDASLEDIDNFAFDVDSQADVFDSAHDILDAVYKKTAVVRKGKKVRINKRVSGTVRLTAAQKVSIRKAHMKSNNAAARMSRMKSLRVRSRMNLAKK